MFIVRVPEYLQNVNAKDCKLFQGHKTRYLCVTMSLKCMRMYLRAVRSSLRQ
jgi:hypothetical protein